MREDFYLEDVKPKERGRKIPSYFLLVLLGFLFLFAYFASMIDNALPWVVTEDEAGLTRFSEERTWRYLREIVGSGPRVPGTQYHLTKTVDLKNLLEQVTADAIQPVHIDWQFVSGDFWLDVARPFVNMYTNVSNIIVVLEGESGFHENGTTGSSILFNCHHDTVPTSPGVADNAIFCATFVETLALLSRRQNKFKHNIIFLFNGAEESQLQGSIGFLQHPWSKGVTALVNLEAAGTNCKSMLFQVSDPRVVAAYSRSVWWPNAQALGQVVFGSGIVPSDSDFRIFRDFGQIHGIDVAYSQVGHVYHTKHDSLEVLKEGVIQHSGDMVFALAVDMADSDDFHFKVTEPSTTMYWDYLNLFMVNYSFTVAHVIDVLMIAVSNFSVIYYHWMVGFRFSLTLELLLNVLARLLSAVAGLSLMWIVTGIMVATTIQLRYMANDWIVVPIFWFPYLIGAVATSQLIDAWRCNKCGLNRVRRMSQAMASTRLILTVISLVLVCIPNTVLMRYVIIIPLFLMSLAAFISITVIKRWRIKAWQQVILEFVLAIPVQMYFFIIAIKVNTLMIPIMGRSPSTNPDYVVAALNMIMILMCCLPLSGIELLFSRVRIWVALLVTGVICLAVSFTPIHPYSDHGNPPVPQRHSWFHSEIITYNYAGVITDHRVGIWFAHTEINTPHHVVQFAEQAGIQLEGLKKDFSEDCSLYTYCNLPMYTPRTSEFIQNSLWAEFSPALPSQPAPILTLEERVCNGNLCRLYFTFTGPPHMALIIWPRANVNLVAWSFTSAISETVSLDDRPVYFVFHSRATYSETVDIVDFSVNFEIPTSSQTEPIVDLTLCAHRVSHPEQFTSQYRALTEAMPDYYNIATFLSTRYNYVF